MAEPIAGRRAAELAALDRKRTQGVYAAGSSIEPAGRGHVGKGGPAATEGTAFGDALHRKSSGEPCQVRSLRPAHSSARRYGVGGASTRCAVLAGVWI